MSFLRLITFLLLLLSGNVLADTQQEIDHLLDYVAGTSCEYDRNGTIYTGLEARDHIYTKYSHYRKKVKTAEDFIRYSATKSIISGRKYQIRCPDAEPVDASDWLLEELNHYRESHNG